MTPPTGSRATEASRASLLIGLFGVLITAGALVIYDAFVLVALGGSCRDIPPTRDRLVGLAWMVGGVLVASVPWVFAFRQTRFKLWAGLAGAVATAPAWYYVIYALTPAHWATGFCF